MKKIAQLLILLLICVSCDDDNGNVLNLDETQIEEETQLVGFFNLVVGNQWAYEVFVRILNTDQFESEEVTFTREVISEEIINGERIFTIEENTIGNSSFAPPEGLSTYQVKDSLGYLVRLDRGILFSSQNTNDYLIRSEGFGDIFGALLEEKETITIESGTFECDVNEIYALLNPDGEISIGRNNELYAEGVGQILTRESSVSQSQHLFEVRLIDFNFPSQN